MNNFPTPQLVPTTKAVIDQSAVATKSAAPVSAGNNQAIWNVSIPAGQTFLIPGIGTFYEVIVASGAIAIRCSSNSFTGQYNPIQPGFGQRDLDFTKLEVQNLSKTNAVAVSIIVGTGAFTNRQLIVDTNSTPPVAYPTNPVPLATTRIDIPDLSGTQFSDVNGNAWIAVNRVGILIFNLDTGDTYRLLSYGSTNPTGPAIAAIPPAPLPIQIPVSGNYSIYIGGSTINMIVSEIYNAIPASSISSI